jgi:hypothetical protein
LARLKGGSSGWSDLPPLLGRELSLLPDKYLLFSCENRTARAFYKAEAVRGGWSVRQLDQQNGSQFYERVALTKNRAALLTNGSYEPRTVSGADHQRRNRFNTSRGGCRSVGGG